MVATFNPETHDTMKTTVLIIDDDIDFQAATAVLLESKGYTVSSANNGADGYLTAKADKPGVILLDVMMTYDSEGFEVARKLHEDPATTAIPVIMITGIKDAMNLAAPIKPDISWLPVTHILEKPVKSETLLKTIHKVTAPHT